MGPRAFMGGLGLGVLALVGAVASLRQTAPPARPAEAPRVVAPERPALRAAENGEGWLGVLVAEEALDVASRLEARVDSVRVQVGSVVRQGDVLVTLDARRLREDLAIAEAGQLSSKAELEMAGLSLEQSRERLERRESPEQLRLQALSAEELSVARYELRMAAAKLEVARAKVLEQEARVSQLRQQVGEASLRAPFDGVVAGRYVHAGALARAGQTLVHLLRSGKSQVRFAIPMREMRAVAVGQPVRVRVPEGGLVLEGQVTQVAPEVDVATRMVFALADVTVRPGSPVPAGSVVRVTVSGEQARAASTGTGN
ncbi:efflux RND transporter periplasmic adaptor subunit [Archangium primigenium]|uniref:efflux RND transporter periplasmic adaptor subunit n=1 Tax=[Archangium] primigenium TaxID=2792470 RepID=UPI00195A467F|nr:efflux RND transporter periplasmic adaptor subunit [Archangium primigenium]MBM7116774.1 efflux RND transporter periplasmic adaptor subunit [Archangium primigenium]